MESRLIHKTSERLKFYIAWVKPSDTEWIYCGEAGEVKWDVVTDELNNFFKGDRFCVATTRASSFEVDKTGLLLSIQNIIGRKNFFIWSEDFKNVVEFNYIGVFRKGVFNSATT